MKLRWFVTSIITGCALFLAGYTVLTQASFRSMQSGGIEYVADIGGFVEAVAVSDHTAYIGEGAKFVTLDVSTNPPSRQAELDLLSIIIDIQLDGNTAYVAGRSGLQIVDVSNPISPTLRGHYDTPGGIGGIYVAGSTVYLGAWEGLFILDVSDIDNPILLGKYSGNFLDVYLVVNHTNAG